MINTQRPTAYEQASGVRSIHYYYEGVRRIQEVISDPFGWYSPQPIAEGDEEDPTAWCDREYVYSPFYVDSYVCQYDYAGNVGYVIQDANYNAIALTDDNGGVLAQVTYDPYGQPLTYESNDLPPKS